MYSNIVPSVSRHIMAWSRYACLYRAIIYCLSGHHVPEIVHDNNSMIGRLIPSRWNSHNTNFKLLDWLSTIFFKWDREFGKLKFVNHIVTWIDECSFQQWRHSDNWFSCLRDICLTSLLLWQLVDYWVASDINTSAVNTAQIGTSIHCLELLTANDDFCIV